MSNLFTPLTPSEFLAGMYVATYDRAPDQGGLNFWLNATGNPTYPPTVPPSSLPPEDAAQIATDTNVITGFTTDNSVYQANYAALNNTDFVKAIYQNVLGANGDAGGQAYWISTLSPGGATYYADRGAMVSAFVYAALTWDSSAASNPGLTAQELAAAVARQDQLHNKIQVSMDYVNILGSLTNVPYLPQPPALDNHTIDTNSAAYKASVAILQQVTADPSTVLNAFSFIDQAHASANPLQYIIDLLPLPVPQTDLDLKTSTDYIDTTGIIGNVTVHGEFGNQFFNSGIANTFNGGDVVLGNANTTLMLHDNGTFGTQNVNLVSNNTTITNVGHLVINSDEAIQIDTSNQANPSSLITNFTNLQTLEVHSSSGQPDGNYNHVDTITADVTTTVKVVDTVQMDWQPLEGGNGLTVNGGKTVTVNEINGGHAGEATIHVNGYNGTTDVTVNQTGIYLNDPQVALLGSKQKSQDVKIVDYASNFRSQVVPFTAGTVAASITNVTLSGLFWAQAVVASDGLSNLTINDSSASDVKLYNYQDNLGAVSTLNLNLNNDQSLNHDLEVRNLAIIDETSVYKVLHVTTGPLPSEIDLDNFNALTTLTVTGQSVLTVDPTLIKLQTITVTDGLGHAGFIDLSLYASTLLTSVDASRASGVVAVLGLNGGNTSFVGGSGNTLVGITADATKSFTAGSIGNIGTGGYQTSIPNGTTTGNVSNIGFDTKIAVLEGNSSFFTAANTTANLLGFSTLGTDGYSSGNFVVNGTNAILSGINSVNVLSSAGTQSAGTPLMFTGAADSTTLQFSGQDTAMDAKLWTGTGGPSTYIFLRADNTSYDVNTLYVTMGVSTAQSQAWAGALEATQGFVIDTLALGNAQNLAYDGTYKGTPIGGTINVEFNSVGSNGTWGYNSINNLLDQQLGNLTLIGTYGLQIDSFNGPNAPYVNDNSSLTLTDNGTSAMLAAAAAINGEDADKTGLVFRDGILAHELNVLNLWGTDVTTHKGANSITIGELDLHYYGNESSSLTINDHAAGSVQIGSICDQQSDLFVLTINNNFSTSGNVLHLGGSYGGYATIGSTNLQTINLNGMVAVGNVDVDTKHTYVFGFQTDSANPGILFSNSHRGFHVNAGTDNADVAIGTCGANAGYTDTFVMGNGNNFIQDQSGTATSGDSTTAMSTGVVDITVGTGANLIVLGNDTAYPATGDQQSGPAIVNAGGYSQYHVSIGGGTSANDTIDVSSITSTSFSTEGSTATGYLPSTIIDGAHHGTLIGDTAVYGNSYVSDLITGVYNDLTNTLVNADTSTTLHALYVAAIGDTSATYFGHVEWAVAQGNTYIVENVNGNIATVELTGVHSLTETFVQHGPTTVHYAQVV